MAKSDIKKAISSTEDVQAIRDDLDALKSDIASLAKTVRTTGENRVVSMRNLAEAKASDLADAGKERLENVETTIQDNPGRSVALAFAAGLLTSFLINRS